MAVYSDIPAQSGILAAFDRVVNTFADFMVSLSVSTQRARQLEALNEMSDAELAEKGLNREDIVRHVFRDVYYV